MVRNILAIVAGYAAMAVVVMAGFAVSLVAPDFAFQDKGSTQITDGWIIWALFVSFAAAAVGGFVTAKIARAQWPVWVLAGLVVVFGTISAYDNGRKLPTSLTSEEIAALSVMDKARLARQPEWYAWLLPAIAGVGVIIGGLKRKGD